MKIPDSKVLLKLYSEEILKGLNNLEDYLNSDDKISELNLLIHFKLANVFGILLDNSQDSHTLIRRLKRVKKQIITLCLELLSLSSDENVRNLMRRISNKRHCWRIVCDKNLKYDWSLIEGIFD